MVDDLAMQDEPITILSSDEEEEAGSQTVVAESSKPLHQETDLIEQEKRELLGM